MIESDSIKSATPLPESESKKTVRAFAWASFLNDMGSDIIYPVWPLFITTYLHANMMVLGLIDGIGEALVSVSQAAAGYFSDRFKKRKVFIWTGYLLGGLSRIGYALSGSWGMALPFKVLDRAGKIRSAPRDAIIADVTPVASRGKTFGLLRAMDNLGAVFGILISAALFPILGFRKLFLLAALPSLGAVILILLAVRERKAEKFSTFKGIQFSSLDRNLKLLFLNGAVSSLGVFSYSFLLMFAVTRGFRIQSVPYFYLLFSAIAALTSFPFGKLADSIGRKAVLLIAGAVWCTACISATAFSGKEEIFALFVLYGLYKGAMEPVQKAVISDYAPAKSRAGIIGAYQMITGLCALPASLMAGWLWYSFGTNFPFILSLCLTASGMLILLGIRTKTAL